MRELQMDEINFISGGEKESFKSELLNNGWYITIAIISALVMVVMVRKYSDPVRSE